MATETIQARVVHHVPGRLRMKVETSEDADALVSRIETNLATRPGFVRAESRPATRSVIVHYNPAQLELEHLLDEGWLAAGIELLESGTRMIAKAGNGTKVGHRIVTSVGAVNGGIGRSTGGLLDLRDIFPLTLFAFGLRRLAQGNLQPMPWYNLLYYGYSTFYALHGRKSGPSAPDPDAIEVARRRFARGEIDEAELARVLAVLGYQT
jgi:hypothetical protein